MNSEALAAQKQWEARNSDRRDTFEGVLYGVRTGEVRTIDYTEAPLRSIWSAESQWGTEGELSDDPIAIRHTHVWPSDVSEPASGTLVLTEVLEVRDVGSDQAGEDLWHWDVYAPAADG